VREYDAAGSEVWTRQFGTVGNDQAAGVALDGAGGVYVVGTFAVAGGTDAFVRKHDAAGGEVWTRQFGTPSADAALAVAADGAGGAYVTGETAGTFPGQTNDSNAASRDSAALNFAGGNPWKPIDTWTQSAAGEPRTLRDLGTMRVWLGLKNSDDQGTPFDLRAELLRNGVPVASGETTCVRGVTRNPASALEASIPFGAISDGAIGPADTLAVGVSARIGTDGNGAFCGGHANATGVRLYFDAQSRPSGFDVAFG
jgi:hypothetical protein